MHIVPQELSLNMDIPKMHYPSLGDMFLTKRWCDTLYGHLYERRKNDKRHLLKTLIQRVSYRSIIQ